MIIVELFSYKFVAFILSSSIRAVALTEVMDNYQNKVPYRAFVDRVVMAGNKLALSPKVSSLSLTLSSLSPSISLFLSLPLSLFFFPLSFFLFISCVCLFM